MILELHLRFKEICMYEENKCFSGLLMLLTIFRMFKAVLRTHCHEQWVSVSTIISLLCH